MRSRWLVCLIMILVLTFAFRVEAGADAGTVYMLAQESNVEPPLTTWSTLYTVDTATGAATKVGDIEHLGALIQLDDIAWDGYNMFGIASDIYAMTRMYSLDFLNPIEGRVRATNTGVILEGLGIAGLGVVFGSDGSLLYGGSLLGTTDDGMAGGLYLLDPNLEMPEYVGPMSTTPGTYTAMGIGPPQMDGGDLAASMLRPWLYGSVVQATDEAVIKYSLAIFDLHTGEATLIGEGWGQTAITGLAFVVDTLYGGDFNGNFYRIDTGDGTLTLLGNNGKAQMGMTSIDWSLPGQRSAPALMLLLD
ncbi:MAG: hypothetical protein C4567_06010 [Deltaproteobacteria bacterium]|nr:MAG: hypothetical protein C4567_06010 [Deltaproteobacteria bacterium]